MNRERDPRGIVAAFFGVILAACLAYPAYAQDNGVPDVYKAVVELSAEIEQVRVAMGRPALPLDAVEEYRVENAEPRHVFFVAQTTHARVNRLAQELAGAQARSSMPVPQGQIGVDQLLEAISQIRGQLQLVKRALGIDAAAPEVPRERKSLNDVLLVLGDAGRQLNVLLGRTLEWSAIYDRTALAMTYVAGALPEDQRYPALPPLEPGKFAIDVFDMIGECIKSARKAAAKVDVEVLRSSVRNREKVLPHMTELEAYDLLTLLLTDIAELTLKMEAKDADRPPYPKPQNVLPSHVHQLLGALNQQLQALAKRS